MAQYMSEEKVMQELGIDDWRHMSKDKVLKFASSLHKMDPEVAKKALEQFPNFATCAGDMVKYYKESIDTVLEKNTKQSELLCEFCNSTVFILQKELERDELTFEQRDKIIDKIIELAGMVQEENKANRSFWIRIFSLLAGLIAILIPALAAALGSNIKHDDK